MSLMFLAALAAALPAASEESARRLDRLQVVANRIEQPVAEALAAVVVLDREAIEAQPGERYSRAASSLARARCGPYRRQRPKHQPVRARRQLQPCPRPDRWGAGGERQHRRLRLGAARAGRDRGGSNTCAARAPATMARMRSAACF